MAHIYCFTRFITIIALGPIPGTAGFYVGTCQCCQLAITRGPARGGRGNQLERRKRLEPLPLGSDASATTAAHILIIHVVVSLCLLSQHRPNPPPPHSPLASHKIHLLTKYMKTATDNQSSSINILKSSIFRYFYPIQEQSTHKESLSKAAK